MKIRDMKMTKVMLALSTAMGLGGCDLTVPDLNRPSVDSLELTPTRPAVISAAEGLLVGNRAGYAAQNGYVSVLGVLGREAYILDKADPRYVGELLAGPALDPGSPAFGGNFWVGPYANLRNANTLLRALEVVPGMSDEEKEAVRGFAKTMKALDYLVLINTRDTNGIVLDVDRPIGADLAPIVTDREQVLAFIAALLDEALVHLKAGGTTFPLPLSSGFQDFDRPAIKMTVPNFQKVNRGIKARVDVYRQKWDEALVDLEGSFENINAPLERGVYHAFGTGSGDTTNELSPAINQNIYAHPSILKDAEYQEGSTTELDARVQRKVRLAETPGNYQGVSSDYWFANYPSGTSPVPIIRNEELILLHAEASYQAGDISNARTLLNFIRVTSGGLSELTPGEGGYDFITELLKQRRYSLLFEGGHRWIDLRRYERLNELPIDVPGHRVHPRFPVPESETNARQ
ncbi:RagB/SusD family nutrient uptake outer membrane protein [Melittangium boletus]|jgi:starch-binding outer membrane protein, SusD/RagB family|uniref:RagB/SusD family nutrient uptake outer membrane protein n=1 Tax=Melittangium boletus TaxID=83453 RepID=UPI003DA1FA19